MKEHKGKLFKVRTEEYEKKIYDLTFRLLDIDDEVCTIEWLQQEPRISKMYTVDLEYFFSSGIYYWV